MPLTPLWFQALDIYNSPHLSGRHFLEVKPNVLFVFLVPHSPGGLSAKQLHSFALIFNHNMEQNRHNNSSHFGPSKQLSISWNGSYWSVRRWMHLMYSACRSSIFCFQTSPFSKTRLTCLHISQFILYRLKMRVSCAGHQSSLWDLECVYTTQKTITHNFILEACHA